MQKIIDQDDWLKRYKNNEFNAIVELICHHHKIDCKKIEKIYCDENALFKIGDKIVKVYNPLVLSKEKQIAEVEGYKRANKLNLPVPKILNTGIIEGEDNCYYMIMDYIDGTSLKCKIPNEEKMIELSYILKNFLSTYNTSPTPKDLFYLRTDCDKFKYELISKGLVADLKKLYNELDFQKVYYVHADLHKGNILLDTKNQFKVIDFGDAKIAPKCCEFPPIICWLYHFNSILVENTFEMPLDILKEELLKGFVVNDFGTDCLQDMCDYLDYGNIKKIKNIQELKQLINKAFEKGKIAR